MIISIYKELAQYEESGIDMVKPLKELGVYNIFSEMDKYYEGHSTMFNKALFFILHAYSIGSKFHVLGQSWMDIKERVAERVGITEEAPLVKRLIPKEEDEEEETEPKFSEILLWTDLVELESSEVVNTVNNYLEYQGNKNFRHLCMLKDQYLQMVSGALDPSIDFDQKNKNRTYAGKILIEIDEWEQKTADSIPELKEAMAEISKKKTQKNSLRMEDNLKK